MQQGTVEEYQEQFEDLRSKLLSTESQFASDYFLSSFLSGLKEEVRTTVKMMKPNSLMQAFELAKLQEQNLAAVTRRNKQWFRTQGGATQPLNSKGGISAMPGRAADATRSNPHRTAAERPPLNRQLIEQTRVAGLCFKCHAPNPLPVGYSSGASNRRRTDRVSPVRPRLATTIMYRNHPGIFF